MVEREGVRMHPLEVVLTLRAARIDNPLTGLAERRRQVCKYLTSPEDQGGPATVANPVRDQAADDRLVDQKPHEPTDVNKRREAVKARKETGMEADRAAVCTQPRCGSDSADLVPKEGQT